MNGVYIREMPDDRLAEEVLPFLERHLGRPADRNLLLRIIPLVKERIKLLGDIVEMADFFFEEGALAYETDALLGKKFAQNSIFAKQTLEQAIRAVEISDPWKHETLESAVRPIAEHLDLKAGDLFGLIRVAVTGRTAAPPLFETMEVLGREKTLQRLRFAIGKLP
jgi:glutamyl-tRNA synthetase